jgi:hypothetical protein
VEAHILQLDENIKQTDTVKGLQEGQQEIKSIIEEEKILNKIAFDKGASMFDDLYAKVEKMEQQITNGFKELGTKITDNEISRLERSLNKREDELKINDKRTWDTTKIIITALLSVGITVILFKFGIK